MVAAGLSGRLAEVCMHTEDEKKGGDGMKAHASQKCGDADVQI